MSKTQSIDITNTNILKNIIAFETTVFQILQLYYRHFPFQIKIPQWAKISVSMYKI